MGRGEAIADSIESLRFLFKSLVFDFLLLNVDS